MRTRFSRMGSSLKLLPALFFILGFIINASSENTDRFDIIIGKTSDRHGVDPMLVKAVISKESNFNPDVRGKAGEIGLMQIRQCTATDWARAFDKAVPSEEELSTPELNIEIGSWYLARAVKKWNGYKYSIVLALCEYNAGGRRAFEWSPADREGEVDIMIESTKNYVRDVMGRYYEFAGEGTLLVSTE